MPVIVVNAGDTGERQRLTIAHELGHIVLARKMLNSASLLG
jgi:Zn-dependent peptidase ImmA (M78 family)